jgi:predicted secreted hydrolase
LRERDGNTSDASSGTFITADGTTQSLHKPDFEIDVLDTWRSPHTPAVYPSSWKIRIDRFDCLLDVQPWMADQELNFPPITYWEGAVRFEGACGGVPVRGNGYIELTGYSGTIPLQ